jgi:cytochrome c553
MKRSLTVLLMVLALVVALSAMASAADIQAQWESSKHNIKNVDTSAQDAPSKRDSCIACHDGQGFSNSTDKRASLPAAVKADPNSIDCNTCHGARGNAIMDSGKAEKLANGYSVVGAGAGALCISCHNGR